MHRNNSRFVATALLFFVNIMWGLSFIFSKTVISEGMPTMTVAFLRYALTAIIMTPICLLRERSLRLGRWAPRALATTLTGVTIYYIFEYNGLARTTASASALIVALVPTMTLLARMLLAKEKVAPARIGCIALSLLGVCLVIGGDAAEGASSLLGYAFMILACICWTAYILISKPLMDACSSLRVTTWQSVVAVVTLAPLALSERSAWVRLSPKAWLCLFLLAAICSAMCYFLYNMAMRSVDAISVALSININPIAACIGGAILLSESLSPLQLLGGVIILLCELANSLLESRKESAA